MTKDEKKHIGLVVGLGCIACLQDGIPDTPAEAHHIRAGVGRGQRASHYEVLPLCPAHHRGTHHPAVASIHLAKRDFINQYGTERELLVKVLALLEGA